LERRRHGRYLNRAEGVGRAGEILSDRPGLGHIQSCHKMMCTRSGRGPAPGCPRRKEMEWSALSRPVLPSGR
jgi:hypothetical protein